MSTSPTRPPADGVQASTERASVFELIGEGRIQRGERFGRKTVVRLESVLALAEGSTSGGRATCKPQPWHAPRRRRSADQFAAELGEAVRRFRDAHRARRQQELPGVLRKGDSQ